MKKNYFLLVFIFILFFNFKLSAQRPGGITSGGKMPSIGRVYGKIIDKSTKEPIPFGSVVALRALGKRDSIVGGQLSLENGDFNLDNLPMGGAKIKISVVGYKDFIKSVTMFPPDVEIDLGDIGLEVNAEVLKTVTVEGQKSSAILSIDKKVFNVEKNITSSGGTAEDVLKNVPSVTVDADGTPKLRNSSTTVYIDGRPTLFSLNQIPSDQIESVEVISNPSSKYEASTSGGIINIVLKKNRKPGYNGFVSLGAANHDRYNGTFNLNIKQGRVNVTGFYSVNSNDVPVNGYTNKTIYSPGDSTYKYYNQNSISQFNTNFQIGRIALDYSINNRNTLTFSSTIVRGVFNVNGTQNSQFLKADGSTYETGVRNVLPLNKFNNQQTQVIWKKTFPKKGKELTIDANYSWGGSSNSQDWISTVNDANGVALAYQPSLTQIRGENTGHQTVVQLDFTNPLNDSTKWEMGLRGYYNYRTSQSLYNQYSYTDPSPGFKEIDPLSSDYNITDIINAAYTTYTSRYHGWGYQAGLRFEQSYLDGISKIGTLADIGYNYPGDGKILNTFFPSLYLSRKIDANDEFQINFSRKINRPNFMQLLPIIMASDLLNIRKGNPGLKPEFVNTFEANFNKTFGYNNWLVSAYLKNVNDPVTNYTYANPEVAGGLISIPTNGNVSNKAGLENTFKWAITNNLEWTNNANVFNTTISSDSLNANAWSYFFKSNAILKFGKGFSTQLSGTFEGKEVILQGYIKERYNVDFAIKKSFSNGAANVTLAVNDIFNSRKQVTVLEGSTFIQESMRRRDIRAFKISVQFPFGKLDSSIFRKAKEGRKQQQQNPNGDQDYGG